MVSDSALKVESPTLATDVTIQLGIPLCVTQGGPQKNLNKNKKNKKKKKKKNCHKRLSYPEKGLEFVSLGSSQAYNSATIAMVIVFMTLKGKVRLVVFTNNPYRETTDITTTSIGL
eukprot:CAMPEP_0206531518 /NCGR_PEP_ID=MMETSP0325_2-20121206/3811_1 /ASSEMBLY_ACC=CAM_ASM_000347 /TAXON_ID=2866 /ORGANISM="Crypthecodinium cohnii, Strain Seligo" /LENGTH=115 /DNA_ID=CAMNT_0054027773 /DNA_START=163 /DNA_END=509 /DNA_ORIENTATION=+